MTHLTPEELEAATGGQAFSHLPGCAQCRAAVADASGRVRLLRSLSHYTLSDMAFRRVEARLMEQVEHGLPEDLPLWRRLWWAGPLTAAALALLWLTTGSAGAPHTFALNPLAGARPVVLAAPRSEPLTVLRASADARLRHETGQWLPLKAGDSLGRGDAVFGSAVQLAASSELPWTFELSGAAALGTDATLSLGSGVLKARVKDATADILVGSLHVLATEAVFSLNRSAAEVLVDVAEGSVELVDTAGAVRRTLQAPVSLRWAEGAKLGSAPQAPAQSVTLAAAPARPWVLFDASQLPAGSTVSLDGLRLANEAQLVTSGRHRLSIAGPGLPARESWLELSAPYQAGLPEAKDELAPEPDARAVTRIQEALKRQRPKLSACYEKWLKANPAAVDTTVELRLVVAADGHVTQATVQGAAMSPSSASCLVETVKALRLPGLGSEVELALPLHLTTAH